MQVYKYYFYSVHKNKHKYKTNINENSKHKKHEIKPNVINPVTFMYTQIIIKIV